MPTRRAVSRTGGLGATGMDLPTLPNVQADLSRPDYRVDDFQLPDDVSRDLFNDRERLLGASTARAHQFEQCAQAVALDTHDARAYDLRATRRTLEASCLSREAPGLLGRHEMNPYGQPVLQARLPVEIGMPVVTVFWPNDGPTDVSVYWDTHNRNFVDLKERLMPAADQAVSALLDETLMVWTGKFGRTPVLIRRWSAAPGPGAMAGTSGCIVFRRSWPVPEFAAEPSSAPRTAWPPIRPRPRIARSTRTPLHPLPGHLDPKRTRPGFGLFAFDHFSF